MFMHFKGKAFISQITNHDKDLRGGTTATDYDYENIAEIILRAKCNFLDSVKNVDVFTYFFFFHWPCNTNL